MPSPRADEEFVERHWRLALWVARRRAAQAGWRGDPDEVESDAMLGLWNAARTWDPDKSGSPAWVRTHVDRAITDGLRYRYGDVRYEGKASITASLLYLDKQVQNRPPATLGEVTPDPRELYAESIDRVDVARALVGLTSRHRYVVVARYHDGLTWRAIGEHLGVTEGRAHQLGTEARQRLTRSLAVPNERLPPPPLTRWWGPSVRSEPCAVPPEALHAWPSQVPGRTSVGVVLQPDQWPHLRMPTPRVRPLGAAVLDPQEELDDLIFSEMDGHESRLLMRRARCGDEHPCRILRTCSTESCSNSRPAVGPTAPRSTSTPTATKPRWRT